MEVDERKQNVPWTEIPVIGSMQKVFLVPPSTPNVCGKQGKTVLGCI